VYARKISAHCLIKSITCQMKRGSNMNNFQQIMSQMERMVNEDDQAFAIDPENQKRIRLVNPEIILKRETNAFERAMLQRIERMDQYSWDRGNDGGLKTGFQSFDDALEGGLKPGLILFAAAPN